MEPDPEGCTPRYLDDPYLEVHEGLPAQGKVAASSSDAPVPVDGSTLAPIAPVEDYKADSTPGKTEPSLSKDMGDLRICWVEEDLEEANEQRCIDSTAGVPERGSPVTCCPAFCSRGGSGR